MSWDSDKARSLKSNVFIALFTLAGLAIMSEGLWRWQSTEPVRFACYLLVAMLASGLKVSLPGITGTMSVNFFFILIGIIDLSFSETLVIGAAAALVQCLWHSRQRPRTIQILFNLGDIAISTTAAYFSYHIAVRHVLNRYLLLALVIAAAIYFVVNTVPIAVIIGLTEKKSFKKIYSECYFWSFPYYLVGATIAALLGWLNNLLGWQIAVVVMPAVYLVYRSYRLYLGKLEDKKHHIEEMASLHLRTIEALALSIEAKDQLAHDHLQRVRVYAVELAKAMNVTETDLQAIHAAALLHDIGKLAVPEHIISKPGRLTPEEFEKMKIHPIVGAEILERVNFPYPVVPIVRAHHEKWDGSGYPYGLKGEEIPMGARILGAVDFVDALASDRQYRPALPMDEALAKLVSESGQSFDPAVVKVLKELYPQLETTVKAKATCSAGSHSLSTEVRVERGEAPGAGLELSQTRSADNSFIGAIAAAREEGQTLFELTQDLGNSLSLGETLSVLALRLKRLVPFDSIAIYVRRENKLIPEHVSGDNFRLFSSLQIPIGEGLSGWVADNKKPIINGNPSAEPGYLADPTKFSTLRSALSVPLEGLGGVVGVLTLYKAEKDSFVGDHLRVLLAVRSKVAISIENALKYQKAENSATIDYLTELPNARSLFLHLDRELARCRRTNSPLAVLVCDLDGFKQVNDRFGHLEGNRVLRTFAQRLQSDCREYDYVARMGGDEFVLVIPEIKPEDAEKKALYLSDVAKDIGKECCGENLLGMSVGLAFYPVDGHDAEGLLAEADRRMYLLKQAHHAAKSSDASLHLQRSDSLSVN